MFLVCLVLTLLCYQPVSSEASRIVSQLSEIERWNKQVAIDADKDGLDKYLYSIHFESHPYSSGGLISGSRKKIQCGEILNITDPISHKPRVFLDIQSLGFIKWKTIVGIEIPGEPLQCKSLVGLIPLKDFSKSIDKRIGLDVLENIWPYMMNFYWEPELRPVYKKLALVLPMEFKDYANCNLCLTEREWIFMAITCVVLALYINNIVFSRLRRERIRIHNPVSETLKLPH